MNNATIRGLLESNQGKIFTAVFTKKNGDLRTMNGRTGVAKDLKGGQSTTAHLSNLVTVWEMSKQGYRTINLNTLQQLSIEGAVIHFKDR